MKIESRKTEQRVLKSDVKNPHPDRRCKDLLSAPVIPAGTKIEVKSWVEAYETSEGDQRLFRSEVHVHPESRQNHQDKYAAVRKDHRGLFHSRLLDASELVEESMSDWLRINEIACTDVLVRLLEKGRLTKQDVQDAHRQIEDEYFAKQGE